MTQATDADREARKSILWVATLIDVEQAIDEAFARHREQAVQEAVAERDARIEGLTIERDFHRETAELHAARIGELEQKLATARGALKWYAEPVLTYAITQGALKWYTEPVLTYAITQASEPRSAAHADKGARARAALQEIDNG